MRAAPLSLLVAAVALGVAACSTVPRQPPSESGAPSARAPLKSGGYYKDDGPGENPPNLDAIQDAQPRPERLHRFANNPYEVFGKQYVPLRTAGNYRERGVASWYGRRYHGQKTSTGETYDMYAMTAAHPTLPIPSYVRVTNVANAKSVVLRVNDRGPFHSDRAIDLSYVAAYKLGYVQNGSALVDIESLPTDGAPAVAAVAPSQPAPPPKPVEIVAAVQPPPQQAAPLMATVDAGGIYVQLGAFSVKDNAENFRAKVYKELAWLNEPMRVQAQGGVYRLQLGPFRSQDDARSMSERIRSELNLQPVLLVR